MKIEKTKKGEAKPIVMLIYGKSGIGKTTFACEFPKPILFDFEQGSKYLGERGINVDAVQMSDWFSVTEKKELFEVIKNYETIVIDTIGKAMNYIIASDELSTPKYRQPNGDLTAAGWGKAKDILRNFITAVKNSGKHIIFIGHRAEIYNANTEATFYSPMIATKIANEVLADMDFVGYFDVIKGKTKIERIIRFSALDNSYESKDRSDKLGDFITDYQDLKNKLYATK